MLLIHKAILITVIVISESTNKFPPWLHSEDFFGSSDEDNFEETASKRGKTDYAGKKCIL